MNVLWVFAHPEQASLSGVLRDEGVRALVEAGHEVRMSDLYAMKWKAVVDRDDFPEETGSRLEVAAASRRAYDDGTLSADIRAEHEKLRWADTVVLQFPLWWYGTPAIMKGWMDRVFVKGFGYGVTDPDDGRTLRYGEGVLAGKRALVVLTAGSREPAFGPRGINGQLDLALFPLLHGTLWYTGMSVLPPVAIYGADRVSPEALEAATSLVRSKVLSAGTDTPLPYRHQNGGDYDSDLVLLPGHHPGQTGLAVHYHPA
ncbi:NAD(P)H-dependent oxidoreductase [Amycolatopsis sp. YIM 10]|uniref:NAD(P)H-dependent oxidoreductase n=1 Tax=Amycolatopsis sp. YIM 10 TaxID=2653857 RepID=UPI0012905459|nr:NAD(P)H-dependent oxidoreductase [Amycolatopsis sp. YIM 10]QFU88063.1 Glutathione-regulated potassium-efflux system ancillary protein KefF [Amycolatopsis sp. YIM 10]